MNPQNVNTAAPESSGRWSEGSYSAPNRILRTQKENFMSASSPSQAAVTPSVKSADNSLNRVFFLSETCRIFSMAVTIASASEPVAMCNFEGLEELRRQYPDMIIISESEANARIAEKDRQKKAAEQAFIEAARAKDRESGYKFTCKDAGK